MTTNPTDALTSDHMGTAASHPAGTSFSNSTGTLTSDALGHPTDIPAADRDVSDPLAEQIAALLIRRGEALAVAETSAGGHISARLLALAGASAWYLGGCVAYSTDAKRTWLGLDTDAVTGHGIVSQPAAQLMAGAARERLGATWGLAETGITGPQGGRRSAKPAGLVYIAVAGPAPATLELITGHDHRVQNQREFAQQALRLLLTCLQRAGGAAMPG